MSYNLKELGLEERTELTKISCKLNMRIWTRSVWIPSPTRASVQFLRTQLVRAFGLLSLGPLASEEGHGSAWSLIWHRIGTT
jgi:hypothetical protein